MINMGIIGVNNWGKVSKTELENLARNTLNFKPLEKIFRIEHIGIEKEGISYIGKKKTKIDLVAIIGKKLNGRYEEKKGLKIVYSNLDPPTFAHELGHSVGLIHPLLCDNVCLKDKLVNFAMMIYGDCEPHKNKDIMACDIDNNSLDYKFSLSDIQKLNEIALKT